MRSTAVRRPRTWDVAELLVENTNAGQLLELFADQLTDAAKLAMAVGCFQPQFDRLSLFQQRACATSA